MTILITTGYRREDFTEKEQRLNELELLFNMLASDNYHFDGLIIREHLDYELSNGLCCLCINTENKTVNYHHNYQLFIWYFNNKRGRPLCLIDVINNYDKLIIDSDKVFLDQLYLNNFIKFYGDIEAQTLLFKVGKKKIKKK